jgi:hypothetical protein
MTIVGAFAVPAEKNETYTMVDTAGGAMGSDLSI